MNKHQMMPCHNRAMKTNRAESGVRELAKGEGFGKFKEQQDDECDYNRVNEAVSQGRDHTEQTMML